MNSFILTISICVLTASAGSAQFTGKLGYGVSPAGHPSDFSQFGAFLQEVANTCDGGVVMGNGKWRDNINSSGQIPSLHKAVSQLQPAPYPYTDLLAFGWATYPSLYLNTNSNPTNNWSNPDMRALFLQMLVRTADSLAPPYIFVGNEVSFYLPQDSADYANWSSFYSQAYDSIKAHSPGTKVGTIFNYEHLAGLGSNTGWTVPHWNALTDLDTSRIDIVGITLYPFFSSASANAVPLNYLDPLFNLIGNKPVAITETGWPGDSLYGPWLASPQQQTDWVNRLFTMIDGRNVEVVNWLFLNYMMDNATTPDVLIFKSVSLRDSLGNDRPALSAWLSNCSGSGVPNEKEEALRVFPNPFSGKLFLRSDRPVKNGSLTLTNLYGEVVHQRESVRLTADETLVVECEELPAGLYFLRLLEGDELIGVERVVIGE